MYLNDVRILGNLTRDPEMKAMPSGSNVTSMSIATNRKFKDRDGNMQEATDYHNIIVFGAQAESANTYLRKGSQALIQGRLQTRSWEKDGQKQYRTEVIANQVTFGAKPQNTAAPAPVATPAEPAKIPNTNQDYPESEIDPNDIPF